jgi:phosphoglucosamine mutase
MITASHNGYTDNGVKLFATGGLKLNDEVETAIEARIEELLAAGASDDETIEPDASEDADAEAIAPDADAGGAAVADGYVEWVAAEYVEWLVALFPEDCLAGLHIVLDCANGSMTTVAPLVAGRLGGRVDVINAAPDGRNINADCGATSPGTLAGAVLASGGDLGLAFDGDGDRVIAIDQHGESVDGDRLIALAALQLRDAEQLVDDTVVVTVMSNLGFRHAMARAGISIVETSVGDRYVLEALDAGGYSLGGEQSGHVIYRKVATTGDGLLAGLRIAQHVHERGRTLAELAGSVMTSYPQVLVNVPVAERHPGITDELAAEIALAEASLDGDGRILVRASGTEALIRVMVEAPTTEAAAATAEHLAGVVRARFG